MCFKTPDIPAPPPPRIDPPPLLEAPEGVDIGGSDKDKGESSGRKAVTIKKDVTKQMATKQTQGVVRKSSATSKANTTVSGGK